MCYKFVNLLTTLVVKCLRAKDSLRKQPTFFDPTNIFSGKLCLRKVRGDSILMTCPYPDLGSTSDWIKICLKQSWKHDLDLGSDRHGISMEFLCSFLLWYHFPGKLLVRSQNVDSFCRLGSGYRFFFSLQ